jgi:3-methyl-2-oxobutanoate hydroxymethyltransferase
VTQTLQRKVLKSLYIYNANAQKDLFYSNVEPSPLLSLLSTKICAMSVNKEVKKITTNTLLKMKQAGEKISMITAYDFSFAKIFDAAGIDIILVGDSASNVMAGHETTLPITLDQMIYHASSVVRGIDRCLVVVDLPFGSYQGNSKEALISTIKIMKETGAHGIKLEGGEEVIESVKRIISSGVPVMGHLGLTPQSIYKFGTYTVRAREEQEAEKLKRDAVFLQEAGCFGIVLEKIPASLAKEVSEQLSIPTIGIGAGRYCDGQVLVMHDMLGINTEFKPRFLRTYLNLHEQVTSAVHQYIKDIKSKNFPNESEQY